jgi:hypothetical protein
MKATKSHRIYFQLVAKTHPTEGIEFGLLQTPRSVMMDETPEAFQARKKKNGYVNGTKYPNLLCQVKYSGMLPTPNTFDWNTARTKEKWEEDKEKWKKKGVNLHNPLKQMASHGLLPTPRTADVEGGVVKNVKNDGKGYYRENKKGVRWGVKLRDVVESGMLPTPMAQEADKITGKENQNSLTKLARSETGKTSQLNPLFVEEMMGFPKDWTVSPFQSGEKKV